jgi:predicted aspartyl protease
MIYTFEKEPKSGLILVDILIDGIYDFKMMLDTGASYTTFDFNPLYIAGYPIGNIVGTGMVETASGKMEVDVIETKAISALGHTVHGMKIQMYDFFKHGIISDYDGLLGLDFFENTKFTIDMNHQTIEVIR